MLLFRHLPRSDRCCRVPNYDYASDFSVGAALLSILFMVFTGGYGGVSVLARNEGGIIDDFQEGISERYRRSIEWSKALPGW